MNMKTRTQLEHLIDAEAAKITRLQKEDNAIWTRKSPPRTDEDAKHSKKIRAEITRSQNEIKHLRKLILYVESTTEEANTAMRDRIAQEIANVEAVLVGKSKEMKASYGSAVNLPLKRKQLKELNFILNDK